MNRPSGQEFGRSMGAGSYAIEGATRIVGGREIVGRVTDEGGLRRRSADCRKGVQRERASWFQPWSIRSPKIADQEFADT
jgi:hypothetical protein